MGHQSIIERSFTGGELSPALYARVDQTRYASGARTLRNMICMRHGGATQRPGGMYIGSALNSGAAVRLIPFIYNESGDGQSYVLEFGNLYVAFYQNGGNVLNVGVPYKVATPYVQADLTALNFAQSNDVITITCQNRNYAPRDLVRVAPTNWTLNLSTFIGTSSSVNISSFAGGAAGGPAYYSVTAIMPNGDENVGSGISATAAGQLATAAAPVLITWGAVAGASSYRVYKFSASTTNPGDVSLMGYIGSSGTTTFTDSGIDPDYTSTPAVTGALYALVAAGQYPANVGYVQQRRIFSNVPNNPIGAWASAAGSFTNFNINNPTSDADGYSFTLSGDQVNSIKHIIELKFMLGMTSGAELFLQGNGSGVVAPSAINASVQSYYGSSNLRPIKVGEVCIFLQALGNFVRDLGFDFVTDGYHGNDLTVFSSHLFEGHQIVAWSYQKIPDSIIWAVREDGVLLSLTYVREQQIIAWTRHDFTNGFVEDVVSIPENGTYGTYMVVRRVINGSTVRYIERLSSRIWTDPLTATYLDCFLGYDGRNTGSTTMTLTASGGFSTSGTAYQQLLTLTSSANYFGTGQTAQVGDQIVFQDAVFISSQGAQGYQARLTIQSISSTTVAVVTPDTAVAAEFQAVATTSWSRAVKSVSGVSHLRGQSVSIWADRFIVGSPLNSIVTKGVPYVVSETGTLTLDKCYSVIYVGLPMTTDLETLQIDTISGNSVLDERKNISRVVVYLYNSRGFFGGTQNPDTDPDNLVNGVVQDALFNMTENKAQEDRLTYDQAPPLFSQDQFTNVSCNWSEEGRIFVRNVDPIPLSILAVIPGGLTSARDSNSLRI